MLPGGVWAGGVSAPGGCLLPGGFSLPGVGGGLVLGGGVCSRGVSLWGGGDLPARGGSPCLETPPVNRITHTCKNITLATTSLRPVKTRLKSDSAAKFIATDYFSITVREIVLVL